MKQKEDVLNRQPFIDKLASILQVLSEEKRGASFAIDGEWGSGKSFVLEQLEKQLEPTQSEKTFDDRYFLFHYNCWQYDYYEEPAIAIVSAMLEKANSINSSNAGKVVAASWTVVKDKLRSICSDFIKNKIGVDVVETINEIKEVAQDFQTAMDNQKVDNSSFDNYFSFKQTLDNMRKTIGEIAEEKTVVIIVDELDRCLPDYAVRTLERFHHIFDGIANVVIIYAIDAEQLHYTVKSIFGSKDDNAVDRYLRKFIGFQLRLDYGDIQDNVWDKYQNYFGLFKGKHFPEEKAAVRETVIKLFQCSHIDIRNQENLIEGVATAHRIVHPEKGADYSILLFELLVSVFSYLSPGTELQALPEIRHPAYAKLNETLGTDLLEFLKELEDGTAGGRHLEGKTAADGTEGRRTINLSYYFLYSLFSEEKKYTEAKVRGSKMELAVCRKFVEMKEILA